MKTQLYAGPREHRETPERRECVNMCQACMKLAERGGRVRTHADKWLNKRRQCSTDARHKE